MQPGVDESNDPHHPTRVGAALETEELEPLRRFGIAVQPQLFPLGAGLLSQPPRQMVYQLEGSGPAIPYQFDPAADFAIGTESDKGRRRR